MSDAIKTNERAAVWKRNMEFLISGGFGDISNAETILKYWMEQERAGYPGARENVMYFEDMLGVSRHELGKAD